MKLWHLLVVYLVMLVVTSLSSYVVLQFVLNVLRANGVKGL